MLPIYKFILRSLTQSLVTTRTSCELMASHFQALGSYKKFKASKVRLHVILQWWVLLIFRYFSSRLHYKTSNFCWERMIVNANATKVRWWVIYRLCPMVLFPVVAKIHYQPSKSSIKKSSTWGNRIVIWSGWRNTHRLGIVRITLIIGVFL